MILSSCKRVNLSTPNVKIAFIMLHNYGLNDQDKSYELQ